MTAEPDQRSFRFGERGDFLGVEHRAVERELPAEVEQAAEAEPSLGQLLGCGGDGRAELQPVVHQAGRPEHLDADPGEFLGRDAEQAAERVVVESIAEGLTWSSAAASGGQTAAPRRSASSRSASACGPNLASTVSGWLHSAAASTIRLGSAVLRSWSTSRSAGTGASTASSPSCASSSSPGLSRVQRRLVVPRRDRLDPQPEAGARSQSLRGVGEPVGEVADSGRLEGGERG